MKKAIIEKLKGLARAAENIHSFEDYSRWKGRVSQFLFTAIGSEEVEAYLKISTEDFSAGLGQQIGFLEGLAAKGMAEEWRETVDEGTKTPTTVMDPRKVFIVHGSDEGAKESVARFVGNAGLDPIILHEQASGGRTIIEKFEVYADIPFAIIILTPDDVGAASSESEKLQPRARQNVILELGYFFGKLGRSKVCALHKAGIEIPSDIQGVVYIPMDDERGWQMKLAQELVEAKMPISLEAIVRK